MNEVKQTVKGGFMAVMRVSVLLVKNVSSVSESNLFLVSFFPDNMDDFPPRDTHRPEIPIARGLST